MGYKRIASLHLDDLGTLHRNHSFDSDLCPANTVNDIALSDDRVMASHCNEWWLRNAHCSRLPRTAQPHRTSQRSRSVFKNALRLHLIITTKNSGESPSGRRLESSDLHDREPILFSHRLDRPVKMLSMNTLAATAYDVLIRTIAFLYVPDVRLLRQYINGSTH
ncbi:hypothetical protein ARMSODRAFT_297519 [Armillaria solidipes]|uniref:Uncharacterized protein n=1 Tax=Armillaria solidipes TaxID=1076256 RepID=A0A2H3BUX3_9AGAR|nr:hypothetical protein ARMSODRAFT_297519 [Armillaria solidipes]